MNAHSTSGNGHRASRHARLLRCLRAIALGLAALIPRGALGSANPNILLIVTDDAGYADFGFQGGGIDNDYANLTPNLDSLADNGVRFTSGYVCGPICCPSRAGLLTGRYPQRFGFENNLRDFDYSGLPMTESTIADHLRSLGYRTYAIGKWHLGDYPEHHPNARGFDEFVGFIGGARTYFQYPGTNASQKLQHNDGYLTERPGQYLTDVFASAATNYITTHVAATNAPFFIYLAFNAVHAPMEAKIEDLTHVSVEAITNLNRRTNAAMTLALDRSVGVVLKQLDDLELRTNTLVVFLNDNGGSEDNPALDALNWSDNGPLRAGKRSLHEGGIRVPFVVSWPGTVTNFGSVIDDPVIALDLLPTFVAAAGGRLFPTVTTDGVNLLPRLTGASTRPIERCLFWRSEDPDGEQSAVRKGQWKLYRGYDGTVELYDLAVDPGEDNNVAAQNPEKLAELLGEHAQWEEGVLEPMWGFGAPLSSTPDLIFGPAALGYEVVKSNTGFGFLSYERRTPLSLATNWTLTWSMIPADEPGFARNGFIVLQDTSGGSGQINLIRAGLDASNLTLSIREVQNGDSRSQVIPGPIAELYYFRLSYAAATRTLTLRYGTNQPSIRYGTAKVTHALSGNYALLDHMGYALQSDARTQFSSIRHALDPLAPGRSPSWTRLKMARDYIPGSFDTNGHFMGGTELMSLVPHKGRLYAGIGFWNDEIFAGGSSDPYPGAQVLVKEEAGLPWRQDVAFGTNFLRVECLRSVTLTTDKTGAPLDPPVTLLMAGTTTLSNQYPIVVHVFIRDDATGVWTPTSPGAVNTDLAAARFLFDHVDRVTGIHHVFCAFGSRARVIRGGYNAATGLIDWDPTPELGGRERMVSGGECNGWAYACIGSDGNPNNENGGVFYREDGLHPTWHLIVEFPDHPREVYEDIRGFTAVPHPKGFDYDVALVELNAHSKVVRLDPIGGDPRNGHLITEEVNIETFLGAHWQDGDPIGDNIIAAYNDMPGLPDPVTGEPVHFLGLYIKNHPAGTNTMEYNNTWYLIRRLDATYEWGQVIDPANPIPSPFLRSCRAARLSPFPAEAGRVIYLGGFDAATPPWHNSAWLYRAELPDEKARIRREGNIPVVGIETAYPWSYQLEAVPNLGSSQPLQYRLEGNNAVQEVRVTNAPPAREFYRWRIFR